MKVSEVVDINAARSAALKQAAIEIKTLRDRIYDLEVALGAILILVKRTKGEAP